MNNIRIGKQFTKQSGPFSNPKTINDLCDTVNILRNISSDGSFLIGQDTNGWWIKLKPIKVVEPPIDFDWTLSGKDVTINTGIVHIHGVGDIEIQDEDDPTISGKVTLSGSKEYVYIEVERSSLTGIIAHSYNAPISTISSIRIPLVYLEASTDGTTYTVKRQLYKYDVHFDCPLS